MKNAFQKHQTLKNWVLPTPVFLVPFCSGKWSQFEDI